MNKTIQILILLLFFIACKKEEINSPIDENKKSEFISAVDISSYPEISSTNPFFFDSNGNQKDFLLILKENGINTIRLRLWVNPVNEHSGYEEVQQFSQILKTKGFKIWLSLHYSDTWADPSQQRTPIKWQSLNFQNLSDSVFNYTEKIVKEIEPDYIQIGNEINNGFLFPTGNITSNFNNFYLLLSKAKDAIRKNSKNAQIILHYAGIDGSDWFFNQVKHFDFDIIALSYYPVWHGKSLVNLKNTMQQLSEKYQKKIMIAETSYPFTLDWNDWTNNIVGLDEHLILPEYPATINGQRDFIKNIRILIKDEKKGLGFCYWGGELIAWKGKQATNGSPWENQALFDFQNKALPVLKEFQFE